MLADENRTFSASFGIHITDTLEFAAFARRTDKDTDTDGFDFNGGALQGLPVDDLSYSNTEDTSYGAQLSLDALEGRWQNRLQASRSKNNLDGGNFGNRSERTNLKLDSRVSWADQGRLRNSTTLFVERENERFKMPFRSMQARLPHNDGSSPVLASNISWCLIGSLSPRRYVRITTTASTTRPPTP